MEQGTGKNQVRGSLLLLLIALIWGTSFVAQSVGVKEFGAFTYNAYRTLLAAIVLFVIAVVGDKFGKKKNYNPAIDSWKSKGNIKGGIICGLALFVSTILQQTGMRFTSVGKSGFITVLYIVIVPIIGLFLKKRVPGLVWVSVFIAAFGLYLMCYIEDVSLNIGDVLVFISAFGFALHIVVTDHFAPSANGVKMSCIQFLISGLLSLIGMLIFERNSFVDVIRAIWFPIVYTGIFSCAIAHTIQIVAQRDTDPTVASLIMSLESVFAAIAGFLLLGETLTPRELLGCSIVFIAIILAQVPQMLQSRRQKQLLREAPKDKTQKEEP